MEEFIDYIREKYHYGDHHISTIYDMESMFANVHDRELSKIFLAVETHGIDAGFQMLLDLNEDTYTPTIKAKIFDFLSKSDKLFGLWPDKESCNFQINNHLFEPYIEFIQKYKKEIGELFIEGGIITTKEEGDLIVESQVEWLREGNDDAVVQNLFDKHIIPINKLLELVENLENLNMDNFISKFNTTSSGELGGLMFAHFLQKIWGKKIFILSAKVQADGKLFVWFYPKDKKYFDKCKEAGWASRTFYDPADNTHKIIIDVTSASKISNFFDGINFEKKKVKNINKINSLFLNDVLKNIYPNDTILVEPKRIFSEKKNIDYTKPYNDIGGREAIKEKFNKIIRKLLEG